MEPLRDRLFGGSLRVNRIVILIEFMVVALLWYAIIQASGTDHRTWLDADMLSFAFGSSQLHITNGFAFFFASLAFTFIVHATAGYKIVRQFDARAEAEMRKHPNPKRLVLNGLAYGLGISILLILVGCAWLILA